VYFHYVDIINVSKHNTFLLMMQDIKMRMRLIKLPVDNSLQLSTCFYSNSVVYSRFNRTLRMSTGLNRKSENYKPIDNTLYLSTGLLCCAHQQQPIENPTNLNTPRTPKSQEKNTQITNTRSNEVRPQCLRPRGNQREIYFTWKKITLVGSLFECKRAPAVPSPGSSTRHKP